MKIRVQVRPNSKHEEVLEIENGLYQVRVNSPPVDGKANKRVVELLAKCLKRPKTSIVLKSGHKAKIKVFELL